MYWSSLSYYSGGGETPGHYCTYGRIFSPLPPILESFYNKVNTHALEESLLKASYSFSVCDIGISKNLF